MSFLAASLLLLQVVPPAPQLSAADLQALYGMELQGNIEMCDAMGRMSLEGQRIGRAQRETASQLALAKEEVAKVQGGSGTDQRALGQHEGVLAMNIAQQLAEAEALRVAVEDLARAIRERCGA